MSISSIPHKKHIKPINYPSEEETFRPSRRLVPTYMTKTAEFVNRPTGRRHVPAVSPVAVPATPAPFRRQRRPAPAALADDASEGAADRPHRRLFPERRVSAVSLVWNIPEASPRVRPLDPEKFAALCASTARTFVDGRSARHALADRERGTPNLLSWR